jgi:hypothetical protein
MKPPKVTKRAIEQIIDLSEFAKGVDFSDSKSLKLAIGEALAEKIRERAESGKGLDFKDDGTARTVALKSPYSKTYAESLDFNAAGKSRGEVNMTLTGDMLASIQVEDRGKGKIAVFIDGETEVLKAYNHITGDTVPRRPFFGVSKTDVRSVLADFESEIEERLAREGERTEEQRGRRAGLDLLSRLDDSSAGARRRRLSDVLAELEGEDGD